MRVETIGDCTLYHGDCLEIMPTLDMVDVVVTSPPYNKGKQWGWKANMKDGYASYGDDMDDNDYVGWQKAVVSECWRLISKDGAIFYNHKPQIKGGTVVLPDRYIPADCNIRQVICWDRGSGVNLGDGHFCPSYEWIILVAQEGFKLKSRSHSAIGDVWRVPPESKRTRHPCPFPVAVATKCIDSNHGEIILDPFMGSGTTGVASAMLGRKFIGVELDEGYFDISCERIQKAYDQPDMFVAQPEKLKQDGMDI
jgi:site-specific DNA-methyltransferase (adenine-specific)